MTQWLIIKKPQFLFHNQENTLLIGQITYDQGEDIDYD